MTFIWINKSRQQELWDLDLYYITGTWWWVRWWLKHRRLDCLLNGWYRRILKKTLKLGVTGLCEGNPPVAGGFLSQRASDAENVSIWWRHHIMKILEVFETTIRHTFPIVAEIKMCRLNIVTSFILVTQILNLVLAFSCVPIMHNRCRVHIPKGNEICTS